jgi:hypothetical protein
MRLARFTRSLPTTVAGAFFTMGIVWGDYITKEAAFEAVVGPASNAIKMGQTVTITVEGSESGEPSVGKRGEISHCGWRGAKQYQLGGFAGTAGRHASGTLLDAA